jgi:hypothetical protein
MHEPEVKAREDVGACVPLREGPFGGDGDLGLLAGDGDGVAEAPGLAAGDLDALLEELLERGDVHDLVLHGLGAVDHERDRPLLLGRRRAPSLPLEQSFRRREEVSELYIEATWAFHPRMVRWAGLILFGRLGRPFSDARARGGNRGHVGSSIREEEICTWLCHCRPSRHPKLGSCR